MDIGLRTSPIDVICQGSPREMAWAQGGGLRDRIAGARDSLSELEGFRLEQPRWLPYKTFRRLAERKAARLMAGLEREQPQMQERFGCWGLPKGQAGDATLCVHGSYWHTTATIQYFPLQRRMRLAYATTCAADHQYLSLQ